MENTPTRVTRASGPFVLGVSDAAERRGSHGFVVCLSLTGLFSGLVTCALTWPAGRLWGYVLGGVLGIAMAASLAAFGMLPKVWKILCLPVVTAAAFYASVLAAAGIELNLPWKHWSMGASPENSPVSMFAGGAVGAFLVVCCVLFLVNPKIGLTPLVNRALLSSVAGGVLGALGYALGSSLGMVIWSGVHALGLTAPTETFRNALGETSHEYSLFVVWQTGVAFVIAFILNRDAAQSRPKESRSTMINKRKPRRRFESDMTLVKILPAFLLIASACSAQQNPPIIQISSPSSGTVVNPGQTLSVTVTSPANASITQVGVVGQDPIGISDVLTSVPAQFSFAIPPDAACRTYVLSAFGLTSAGQYAESASIQIDVEPSDVPVSVSAPMSSITFSAIGEKSPVTLLATFTNGSVLDITHSTYVSYSSSDPTIASVDANGLATAVATGGASLTATYTQGSQSVQVSIPVTVPPQVMTIGPTSLSFGNQNLGTSSAAQQFTVTNAGNGPLNIVSVAAQGDFSETDNCISSSPLSTSGTCTINVIFTPSGTGQRTSALSIANNSSIIPSSISVTGAGVQPGCMNNLVGRGTPGVGQLAPLIDLTWGAQTGATSYNVLRGTATGGPYVLIGNTASVAFSDRTGLTNGSTYYYVVQPFLGTVEMCQSNQEAVTIPNR